MAAPEDSASLTPKSIEAARPQATDYELADGAAPGLRLRVTPKGGKVFRWYVTSLGRVLTIGRWSRAPRTGHVTLGEARVWLERLKDAHRAGRLAEAEAELRALRPGRPAASEPPADAPTVREVGADFMVFISRRRKWPGDVQSVLDADVFPGLGDRPIASLTPRDVRGVVEAVVARGASVHAGRVLGVLRQLFKFAVGRGDLPLGANPATVLEATALGVESNISQRYLSPEEIAAFWRALDNPRAMTPTIKHALRLLLLLGVRSGELLKATWEEVDLKGAKWVVPVAHQKLTYRQEATARPFVVPLPPLALSILGELYALSRSINSANVLASYHAGGAQITDKAIGHAMRRLFTSKPPALAFSGERPSPHDLRRTLRTHLTDTLGVPWHVAERCLNHRLGRISATYDVGDLLAERRAALERWAVYVEQVVSGAPAVVVPLQAKGRP